MCQWADNSKKACEWIGYNRIGYNRNRANHYFPVWGWQYKLKSTILPLSCGNIFYIRPTKTCSWLTSDCAFSSCYMSSVTVILQRQGVITLHLHNHTISMKPVIQQYITLYICRTAWTLLHGFTVMHAAEQSVQFEVLGQSYVACSCWKIFWTRYL